MKKKGYNLSIVGATGAVGVVMLQILEERNFPVDRVRLFASERSTGKLLSFRGESLRVERLEKGSFEETDLALFSAGASRSREYAPAAVRAGAIVIDNSSAFRMDPDVPLVIPEVNPEALRDFRKKGIIANPNCTTIVLVLAITPLHAYARVTRLVVSSYQAVSGAGARAIEELRQQTQDALNGTVTSPQVFPHPIAFNVFPGGWGWEENGYTTEEMKLVRETWKILGDPSIRISPTTVRVPVFRSHSVAVYVETERPLTAAKARELLAQAPGVQVLDEPEKEKYPTPLTVSGRDEVVVGRIREDLSVPNGLNFWAVGDQLRKGAALNAIQIAEGLVERYL